METALLVLGSIGEALALVTKAIAAFQAKDEAAALENLDASLAALADNVAVMRAAIAASDARVAAAIDAKFSAAAAVVAAHVDQTAPSDVVREAMKLLATAFTAPAVAIVPDAPKP